MSKNIHHKKQQILDRVQNLKEKNNKKFYTYQNYALKLKKKLRHSQINKN